MNREKASYRNVNENPCNMCMPMGGILPFKGVEKTMVILHGSQGCATYIRRHIAEHFNEPVDVASSSLNEKGTVYGGERNLKQGLDNLIKLYNPGLIGVLTTCLAETIGEDIRRITADYLKERVLTLPVVTVPTPGYAGSHSEGYWLAAKALVSQLSQETPSHSKINIIIPHISPADIREIKRILRLMNTDYTLFPDFSETLDRPFTKTYTRIPEGGTRITDIAAMSGAAATIQMGLTVEDELSPGKFLETEFGVPLYNVPIPIGLENTDSFIRVLSQITGVRPPLILQQERGRLLDCMIDSHKYNFAGRCVVYGEPELVYAIVRTCMENGISPVVVATGSKKPGLEELFSAGLLNNSLPAAIMNDADFAQIRQKSKEAGATIAIGHSDGRYLTEKEGIPLVRIGFPIHDRVGGQRILSVGYLGTTTLLDRLTNTLLENKYKNYRSSMYKKFFETAEKKSMNKQCRAVLKSDPTEG